MRIKAAVKPSTLIITIFICLAVVVMFNQIVSQFQTEYPDVDINDSSWSFLSGNDTKFGAINSSMNQVQDGINDIGQESGWLASISATFQNLPVFVTAIPSLLFNSLVFIIDVFEGILQSFGINKSSGAFTFLIMAITVAVLFSVINIILKRGE